MAEVIPDEDCGCGISRGEEGYPGRIAYCPIHKAAPQMLAALATLVEDLELHQAGRDCKFGYNLSRGTGPCIPACTQAQQATAQAMGQEVET